VGSNNFPILSFPSKTLAEVCLEWKWFYNL
jgi:hypothetical protein